MAIEIIVPQDIKVGVGVSGGFDSAVLWYSVYKICIERGQECIPVTAPQFDNTLQNADAIVSYIAGVLGGSITETTMVGNPGWDGEIEDDAAVVVRMLDALEADNKTYGTDCFLGNSTMYDPLGDIKNYKLQMHGTANLENLIKDNHPGINWHFPFRISNKVDIINYMKEIDSNVMTELLRLSSGCTKPKKTAGEYTRCGECPSCIERHWACDIAGITDPGTR